MKTLFVLSLCILAGCTHTTVELPGGGKFSRTSLLNSQSVGKVTAKTTGPVAGVVIEGYNSQQTEIAKNALALAAAALGPKP